MKNVEKREEYFKAAVWEQFLLCVCYLDNTQEHRQQKPKQTNTVPLNQETMMWHIR